MIELQEMLHMVFIADWNSYAYIDKNRVVRIELTYRNYYTREEFQEYIKENGYPNYLNGFFMDNKKKHRQDFMDRRMELFDDVEKYYNELLKK